MPDHDELFKELIRNFLFEFLDLFMPPSFTCKMDRSFHVELNTELPAALGPGKSNRTDLVFEIRNKQMKRSIVHIEVESSNDSKFAERMFFYYALLRKKYNLPVLPIAIFSFKNPLSLQSSRLDEEINGIKVASFEFQLIQLNQLQWRDFLELNNPIVSALVSCMAYTEKERLEVKLRCLCHLASKQLTPEKAKIIQRFSDSYLVLSTAEKTILKHRMTELELAQQEAIMTYLNSWERDGLERTHRNDEKSSSSLTFAPIRFARQLFV